MFAALKDIDGFFQSGLGQIRLTLSAQHFANIRERLQLHFDAEASLKADIVKDHYVVTIAMPNINREP